MRKKTVIQVLMVFLIILISSLFYLKYFNKSQEIVKQNINEEKITNNRNNTSTYIDDINYISSDAKGNKYRITAEQAEIKPSNPDVMFLDNVIAYIFIKDSNTIKITSNFGRYNSKNYDTIFSKNVIVIYPNHKITGEYLDFSFLNNLGTMSINVVYNGDNKNLFADKIEMNLATKDTKIFMDSNNKKVLIEGIE